MPSKRTKAFFAQPLAKRVGIAAGGRELVPAGGKVPAEELLDAGRRNQQVLVLLQGGADQSVQHGVVELLPPGRVGEIPDLLFLEPPGRGGVDGRTLVVRADRHAAASTCSKTLQAQDPFKHAPLPSGSSAVDPGPGCGPWPNPPDALSFSTT